MTQWRIIKCHTWEEFLPAVRMQDGAPVDPIYRGHASVDWALVAPSQRHAFQQVTSLLKHGQDVKFGNNSRYKGQIGAFRRLATGMPGVDLRGLDEVEIEALARHNGLVSNLLDWTTSPFVAAFFAFTTALDLANDGRLLAGTLAKSPIDFPSNSVCVWRLGLFPELFIEKEFELIKTLSPVNFWQKAQGGVFTRLTHDDHVDVRSYLSARGLIDHLTQFILPGREITKALHDMEAMNITYATLFHDLRGAALQANVGYTWKMLGGMS